MLPEESIWLRSAIEKFKPADISPMVNLGSSDENFRNSVQPHINRNVIAPAKNLGINFINCDLKKGSGVDIDGDIFSHATRDRIISREPKAILCTNMLEHVRDRKMLAQVIEQILPLGGLVFVTVPFSYPYHPDPIDSMYRPAPDEIPSLFPGYAILTCDVVTSNNLLEDILNRPFPWVVSYCLRTLFPYPNWRGWLSCLHRWAWIYRRYKVSCVVLQKTI